MATITEKREAENKIINAIEAAQSYKDSAATILGQLNTLSDDEIAAAIDGTDTTTKEITALKKTLNTIAGA